MQRRLIGSGVFFLLGFTVAAQTIHGRSGITLPPPPDAQAVPVSDDYFGTKVVDLSLIHIYRKGIT